MRPTHEALIQILQILGGKTHVEAETDQTVVYCQFKTTLGEPIDLVILCVPLIQVENEHYDVRAPIVCPGLSFDTVSTLVGDDPRWGIGDHPRK